MPIPSNKHDNRAERIFYPAFDGGLNLSVPPESLAKNELQEAMNVEFSSQTGSMRVRGGLVWTARFDKFVDYVLPVQGRRGFLARATGTRKIYYLRWNSIWTVSGELTGKGPLSIVAWDDKYLIASGGKLQIFSDDGIPTLETIDESPEHCHYVFLRESRVSVVTDDSDDSVDKTNIRFSHLGDYTSWDEESEEFEKSDMTPKHLSVGYHDGMIIKAVIPLSKDLIIFKSYEDEPGKGTIWRLTNNYPDWTLYEVAHNTGTFSQQSIEIIGNDVFYISASGLTTLSTVTAYGDVKSSWPDRKISNALIPQITPDARLWNIPSKQSIWISPSKDTSELWVFNYSRGIWTKFDFPDVITYVVELDNNIYVFAGRDVYEMNDGYTQDGLYNNKYKIINAYMKLGTLLANNQILIKRAYASFNILPECSAELWLGKFKMTFSSGVSFDYIYDPPNDTQYASEDDDPLFPTGGVLTSRRQCIVRDWAITPEIKIFGGGCSVSTLGLEIVEV